MKRMVVLICAMICVFSSCSKENELLDITQECRFYDNLFGSCYYGLSNTYYDEVVFRENQSFQDYANSVRYSSGDDDCDTVSSPVIDFDKHSVLLKRTSGSGCNVAYIRSIHKDVLNKKIIYEIDVTYEGLCEMFIQSNNWAVVPKIPNDYTIEFNVR